MSTFVCHCASEDCRVNGCQRIRRHRECRFGVPWSPASQFAPQPPVDTTPERMNLLERRFDAVERQLEEIRKLVAGSTG